MADTTTYRIVLELDNKGAITNLQQFKNEAKKAGDDAKKGFDSAGNSVSGFTKYMKEQRQENRQVNFALNEMKDAVALVGLAMNATALNGSAEFKKMNDVINSGIVTFQGLNAVTGLLPGPIGMVVSVVGALATMWLKTADNTEAAKKAAEAYAKIVEDSIEGLPKKQLEAEAKVFRQRADATNAAVKSQKLIIDALEMQYQGYAKAVIPLDSQLNKQKDILKQLEAEAGAQSAMAKVYADAVEKNKQKEAVEARSGVKQKELNASRIDNEIHIINLQEQSATAFASYQGKVLMLTESNAKRRIEIERDVALQILQMKKQAEERELTAIGKKHDITNKPVGKEGDPEYESKLDDYKTYMEDWERLESRYSIERAEIRLSADTKILEIEQAIKEKIIDIRKSTNDTLFEIEQARAEDMAKNEIEKLNVQERYSLERLKIAYDEAMESASVTERLPLYEKYEAEKTKIAEEYARRRSKTEFAESKKTFQSMLGGFKSVYSILSSASSERSDREIESIETERDKKLDALDIQIQAEESGSEKQKALLKQREAVEKEYEQRVKGAKLQAWEADKEAKRNMAIIDTASAIVEAAPDIFRMAMAAAVGVAQIAAINATQAPKFASGTPPGGFIVPPGYPNDTFPIRVSSGERIEVTPEGKLTETSGTTIVFNFNGNSWNEDSVVRALENRMRKMGVTDINTVVRNRNASIVMGA